MANGDELKTLLEDKHARKNRGHKNRSLET